MRDGFFWKAAACAALVVALGSAASLGYVALALGASPEVNVRLSDVVHKGPCCCGERAQRGLVNVRLGDVVRKGDLIAVTAAENNVHRLYLVDTSRKVILVYGGAANALQFTLLATRYYDVDARATVEKEFPFNSRGYTILEMNKYLPKP